MEARGFTEAHEKTCALETNWEKIDIDSVERRLRKKMENQLNMLLSAAVCPSSISPILVGMWVSRWKVFFNHENMADTKYAFVHWYVGEGIREEFLLVCEDMDALEKDNGEIVLGPVGGGKDREEH